MNKTLFALLLSSSICSSFASSGFDEKSDFERGFDAGKASCISVNPATAVQSVICTCVFNSLDVIDKDLEMITNYVDGHTVAKIIYSGHDCKQQKAAIPSCNR